MPADQPRLAQDTLMFKEAAQSGAAVERMLGANRDVVRSLARRLRAASPAGVITCARGSSDNAATFARYAIETRIGAVTGSLGLSVASIYAAPLKFPKGLCLAISQSGASPDLLAAVRQSRLAGAETVALVNAPGSPLADEADCVIELNAGCEKSVAATKSFITSLCALAWMVAEWCEDAALLGEIADLPRKLEEVWRCDWSAALPVLTRMTNGFILGRGPGLGVAQEAALKLKETCGIHAEGMSAAEVEHGPMALARPGFVAFAFVQGDEARSRTEQTARRLIERGVSVIGTGIDIPGAICLPSIPAHPLLEPILQVQSFYRLAAELSVARGHDPDRPPHLNKVTRTL